MSCTRPYLLFWKNEEPTDPNYFHHPLSFNWTQDRSSRPRETKKTIYLTQRHREHRELIYRKKERTDAQNRSGDHVTNERSWLISFISCPPLIQCKALESQLCVYFERTYIQYHRVFLCDL